MNRSVVVFTILLAMSCHAQTPLKAAYKNHFLIGAALNQSQFSGHATGEIALIQAHFNTITSENVLKWSSVHPQPHRWSFGAADRYVAFGRENGMFVVGHTLIWHRQTPSWVFQDATGHPVDRDTLLARMREHISTVIGRYKGKIGGWDVVNEALADDGSLRPSPWLKIIGDDYLLKAYEFAREADPQVQLYYNDYGLESEPKRAGALALMKKLRAQGARINAVGLQGHYTLDSPAASEVDATITAFSSLGMKVMITELDVDVLPAKSNPYTNGLPHVVQQQLATRYAELFAVFLKHRDRISRVTFWGVTDADSWLDNEPVAGRTNHPLLFDRRCEPKPAFDAVIQLTSSRQK
jgi:endo-1,4-beta-xylanase